MNGILPINKPAGPTAFWLVRKLRKLLNVKKIGHAGTLDPFATGVMVMLVGREYTRLSDTFLQQDKEYKATITLGSSTDTYDSTGTPINTSSYVPSLPEIETALTSFQGSIEQTPPMYSAKKVNGQKLYTLARQGKEIPRKPERITLTTTLLSYAYPHIELHIRCSKGTYIRSIAHDLGALLTSHAHLSCLCRVRSGTYSLEHCFAGEMLDDPDLTPDQIIPYFTGAPHDSLHPGNI